MRTMTRRIRFLAALVATAGVLFAQLAVAAYACPMADEIAAMAGMPLQQSGCGDMAMDSDQPALCQAHCQQGDQSLDKPSAAFPDQGSWVQVREICSASPQAPTVVSPGEQLSLLSRATAPSVALRHCCLRF